MTSNTSFIIAAYSVAWIMIIGYTIRLFAKSARAEGFFAGVTRHREKGS